MKWLKQALKITWFDASCMVLMGIMAWQLATNLPVSMASVTPNSNNYLKDAINGGKVAHWNLEKMPLKVFIANGTKAGNWNVGTKQLVYKAMKTWSTVTNNKLKFVEIASQEDADIVVKWEHQLTHNRLGVSPFKALGNSILCSDVTVATHSPSTGEALDTKDLYETILHELGHALGIQGHSPNPEDVMYWSTSPYQTGELTQTDINTMNALYNLKADITNGVNGEASAGETRWGLVYALQVDKLLKEKKYAQAYAMGMEGLKKAPTNPILLYAVGIGAFQSGREAEGAKYFQKCLQYDAAHAGARHNLAVVLVHTGEKRLQSTGVVDTTTLSLFKMAIDHLTYVAALKDAPTETAILLKKTKAAYARLKTQVALK